MAFRDSFDGGPSVRRSPIHLGKYTLLTRLASGGMGEVYVAQMSGAAGFEKQVVIKRILPQLARDEQLVRMFLDEARITAQLNHPNICQVFELGEIDGEYYIAMEYLEGLTLSQLINKCEERGMDVRIATGLIAQACEGLAYAHEFRDAERQIDGILHRDISPQNLFVTTAGLVKLLDFGIAKQYREGSKTVTNSTQGKYLYTSPEQVQGQPLDRRSDLFALGVVLFEAITGQNLFRRATEFLSLQAIVSGDRPQVSDLRPDVPEALGAVVDRTLGINRYGRHASARALADALRSAMEPLGGPASITELARFIQHTHTAEITESRQRIQRASQKIRAVSVAPETLVADYEPELVGDTIPGHLPEQNSKYGATVPDIGTGADHALPDAASAAAPAPMLPDAASAAASAPMPAPPANAVAAPEVPDLSAPPISTRLGSATDPSSLALSVDARDLDPGMSGGMYPQRRRAIRWGVLAGVLLGLTLWVGRYWGLHDESVNNVRAMRSAAPSLVAQPSVPHSGLGLTDVAADRVLSDADPARGPALTPAGSAGAAAVASAGAATARVDSSASAEPATATASVTARRESRSKGGLRQGPKAQRKRPRGRARRQANRAGAQRQIRQTGYLTIDASPYAKIFIDGRKIGITPLVKIPLATGLHRIRAVSAAGKIKRLRINIKAGQTITRQIAFSAAK